MPSVNRSMLRSRVSSACRWCRSKKLKCVGKQRPCHNCLQTPTEAICEDEAPLQQSRSFRTFKIDSDEARHLSECSQPKLFVANMSEAEAAVLDNSVCSSRAVRGSAIALQPSRAIFLPVEHALASAQGQVETSGLKPVAIADASRLSKSARNDAPLTASPPQVAHPSILDWQRAPPLQIAILQDRAPAPRRRPLQTPSPPSPPQLRKTSLEADRPPRSDEEDENRRVVARFGASWRRKRRRTQFRSRTRS